jgi:hypothetical protein
VETANTIVHKLFGITGVACGGLIKAPFAGAMRPTELIAALEAIVAEHGDFLTLVDG